VARDPEAKKHLSKKPGSEVVTDKGYHSNETCLRLRAKGVRSYISEPERGRRNWRGKSKERSAVYANRRRIRGERGRGLLRKRGEFLERGFAHVYDRGGMRRLRLRGRANILKRLLVHVGGFNLSVALRKLIGCGTPKGLGGRPFGVFGAVLELVSACRRAATALLRGPSRRTVVSAAARPTGSGRVTRATLSPCGTRGQSARSGLCAPEERGSKTPARSRRMSSTPLERCRSSSQPLAIGARGTATGLLRQALAELRAEGIRTVISVVAEANLPSLKVHRRCGFQVVGTVRMRWRLWHARVEHCGSSTICDSLGSSTFRSSADATPARPEAMSDAALQMASFPWQTCSLRS